MSIKAGHRKTQTPNRPDDPDVRIHPTESAARQLLDNAHVQDDWAPLDDAHTDAACSEPERMSFMFRVDLAVSTCIQCCIRVKSPYGPQ
jgi:hypothetical protein